MRIATRLVAVAIIFLGLNAAMRTVPQIVARSSIPLAGYEPHPYPPGAAQLYRVTANWTTLQPMNPHSLRDERRSGYRTGLLAIPNRGPDIHQSGDGSRFVVVANLHPGKSHVASQDQMISVFDARTGGLLSSHHPAVPLWVMGISDDGTLVYGENTNFNPNDPCANAHIYLVDTRTGRLRRAMTLTARPWDSILATPNLDRLYIVRMADAINCASPSGNNLIVAEYDLVTGRLMRSVRLRNVLAGEWSTQRTVNGQHVLEYWQPGVALSPDGSQLAILDGHSNVLTLIDARTLRVEGTETLIRPQTPFDALAGLAGLVPMSVEAKGEIDGATLEMQYMPDGHSLIVVGRQLRPDKNRFYSSSQSLGIRRVDISSGQVSAWLHGPQTLWSNTIWIAPDGSAVYSLVQHGWTRRTGWLFTLRRHDPSTLRVVARRTFSQNGWVGLVFLR